MIYLYKEEYLFEHESELYFKAENKGYFYYLKFKNDRTSFECFKTDNLISDNNQIIKILADKDRKSYDFFPGTYDEGMYVVDNRTKNKYLNS